MDIGDSIPEFELQDQNGKPFSQKQLMDRPAVIFFYPKDFTPGCTRQACSFRDNMDEFLKLNVQVIGISSDSVGSHTSFASKYSLDYPILSDIRGKVRKSFGVKGALFGLLPGRETFVFNAKGILVYKYNSMLPAEHITSVLKFLKEENESS